MKTLKKVLKTILKIIGILLAVLCIAAVCVYGFVLQYPEIKTDPKVGKWYRVSDSAMKDSEGNRYHALFKKGSGNGVMIYFAGGGVSVNEEMARDDDYNTRLVQPDYLANVTMNMGVWRQRSKAVPLRTGRSSSFPMQQGISTAVRGSFIIPIRTARRRSSITTVTITKPAP